jgi:hypothetical protein
MKILKNVKLFWARATIAPFAAALSILAIMTGVHTIIFPETTFIDGLLGWLVYVWAVMFAFGGFFILYGAGTLNNKWEAAGCILFLGGSVVEAIALLGEFGYDALFTVIILINFSIASFLRVRQLLVKGARLMWVSPPKGSAAMFLLPVLPLIAVMIEPSYILAVIGIVGALGGAVVAFRRAKPDSAAVLVDASTDVVLIQRGVIDDLQKGLVDARKRTDECEKRMGEISHLEIEVSRLSSQVNELLRENKRLQSENNNLRRRVSELETLLGT